MQASIAGIVVPDTELARGARELAHDALPDIAWNHSMRAFCFASLVAQRDDCRYDAELLYVATLFHAFGLLEPYWDLSRRFEIDSADFARRYMQAQGIDARRCEVVWDAIALHMTPGIPEHCAAECRLLSAGVNMDLQGEGLLTLAPDSRAEVQHAFPRGPGFKVRILEFLANGMRDRPDTTYGTFGADILDRADPDYRRRNFCGAVLGAEWAD